MSERQNEIIEAGWQGARSARDMVKKLVALGATPEEIKADIVDMARQAEEEAKIGLGRRDAEGK